MKKLVLILLSFLSLQLQAAYTPVAHQVEISYNSDDVKKQHGELKLYEDETGETLDFKYDFYAPTFESKNRLIIITPTIEGATLLEYLLKDYLVKRGFAVLIPEARPFDFTYGPSTTKQFERSSLRAQQGTLEIIKALTAEESFDQNSIGLLGASLGGIRSAILFGNDSRFRALFVAVAGADFPSIYATTKNSILKPIRAQHMRYLGIKDTATYENYLRQHLVLDPLMITKSPYLENVAMVIAEDDDVVPTYNQWKLWSAIKEAGVHPKTYITNSGHVQGALHLLRYRKKVFEWFLAKLY